MTFRAIDFSKPLPKFIEVPAYNDDELDYDCQIRCRFYELWQDSTGRYPKKALYSSESSVSEQKVDGSCVLSIESTELVNEYMKERKQHNLKEKESVTSKSGDNQSFIFLRSCFSLKFLSTISRKIIRYICRLSVRSDLHTEVL